jgi:hypothetical protein
MGSMKLDVSSGDGAVLGVMDDAVELAEDAGSGDCRKEKEQKAEKRGFAHGTSSPDGRSKNLKR